MPDHQDSWIKIHTTDSNPSDSRHTSGVREGVYAFAAAAIALVIAVSVFWPDGLGRVWVWGLVVLIAAVPGAATIRLVQKANARHVDVSPDALEAARREEQERQIDEAKARGDFDRFGKS